MKYDNRLLLGLSIAIGMVLSAYLVSAAVSGLADQKRYVSVKGLSEKELPADQVIWPILHKEVGNNLVLISETVDRKSKIIKDYLIENGVQENEISLSAPEIIDLQAERYTPNAPPNRYIVTSVLTVSSDKVDVVRPLISRQTELLKQGVALAGGDYRFQIQYNYTKLNDIKAAMVEEAAANARASAEQFAKDSQSSLGKIREATQGQISITDRDPNSPHVKKIRVVTSISYFLKD